VRGDPLNRRGVREGLTGLLFLVGLAVFGGLILWINNFRPGESNYQFSVLFPDGNGVALGAPVRLRGVRIGQVVAVAPSVDQVKLTVLIEKNILIPKQSKITVSQSGLIGETFVDIVPNKGIQASSVAFADFVERCKKDPNAGSVELICPNSDVAQGVSPVRLAQLLESFDRLAARIDDKFIGNIDATVREVGTAARKLGGISADVRRASNSFEKVSTSAERNINSLGVAGQSIEKAGRSVGGAADTLKITITDNRKNLETTLSNLSVASGDLKAVLAELKPTLANGQLGKDLTRLASNAAAASENVRKITDGLSDPATIDSLRETLDAARVTFQNAQKITSDLDEVTGDPNFRKNLRKLVDGLGQLVSTTDSIRVSPRNVSSESSTATDLNEAIREPAAKQ
jgi:phospholipid/cholesterol/gamma-HCH transport system substrate-binding protein